MSGQESHPTSPRSTVNLVDTGEVSQSDLQEFQNSVFGSGFSKGDFTIDKQDFYAQDGAHQLLGTNYGSTAAVDAFKAWKAKQASSGAMYQEYLKLTRDNPGRSATVLVPTDVKKAGVMG